MSWQLLFLSIKPIYEEDMGNTNNIKAVCFLNLLKDVGCKQCNIYYQTVWQMMCPQKYLAFQ